jgi:large subunit ribosomal protein LP2
MKEIAAYIMLVLGGNATPSSGDVSGVLKAAGIASDASAIDAVLAAVDGKSLEEVIAAGTTKFAKLGGGGGGGGGAEVVEEKKEEVEEEEADIGGGDMFGGDGGDDY